MTNDIIQPPWKTIYLVRHGEAEHNVGGDNTILDAPLTARGREQAMALAERSAAVQASAELLVSSPMRRAMETMLLGFPELKTRLDRTGQVVLLDIVQEVSAALSDTPSYPLSTLVESNDGIFLKAGLDFSNLSPDYASKKGVYAPEHAAARARRVRLWLRSRPERTIVVVAHGDILRYIVDGTHSARAWGNTEVVVVTFASHEADADDEALVIEMNKARPEDR